MLHCSISMWRDKKTPPEGMRALSLGRLKGVGKNVATYTIQRFVFMTMWPPPGLPGTMDKVVGDNGLSVVCSVAGVALPALAKPLVAAATVRPSARQDRQTC